MTPPPEPAPAEAPLTRALMVAIKRVVDAYEAVKHTDMPAVLRQEIPWLRDALSAANLRATAAAPLDAIDDDVAGRIAEQQWATPPTETGAASVAAALVIKEPGEPCPKCGGPTEHYCGMACVDMCPRCDLGRVETSQPGEAVTGDGAPDMEAARQLADTMLRSPWLPEYHNLARAFQALERQVAELRPALEGLLAALAMGPLELAAKYGPDAHPDEAVVDAAHKAQAALAAASAVAQEREK